MRSMSQNDSRTPVWLARSYSVRVLVYVGAMLGAGVREAGYGGKPVAASTGIGERIFLQPSFRLKLGC